MSKELRTGLVIVGVVVAILLVAYAAQAAGLTSTTALPYRAQAGVGMGPGGAMMARGSGMMGGGFRAGHMMDPDQMPHRGLGGPDGQFENCPYWQDQNEQ
jgi:hypothetical protein